MSILSNIHCKLSYTGYQGTANLMKALHGELSSISVIAYNKKIKTILKSLGIVHFIETSSNASNIILLKPIFFQANAHQKSYSLEKNLLFTI